MAAMKILIKRLLAVIALVSFSATWAQAPTPVGVWKTFNDPTGQPDGLVRIDELDGEFLGTVIEVFSAATPNPVCDLCEGALKDKPVVGMTILRGLRRDGSGYGGGTILDPDEGRTYRCTAILLDGGRKLEVRGYVGLPLLGRTQTWIRGN
jgi:uncharacterized protein (DUF2147 family)